MGSPGRFRYLDPTGKQIVDSTKLERIAKLAIPPAWKDVRISPRSGAKLQATGLDAAGRKQYLYHPDFRAQQEQAKYDKLIRFAEKLPDLRQAMGEHMTLEPLEREWVCAVAVRVINLTWFRPGSDEYARKSHTFGVTTLRKGHVSVRGKRIAFKFRAKHSVAVRTAVVDVELGNAFSELLKAPGGSRLFRYRAADGSVANLSTRTLNAYIQEHMGPEFTAKDFRTWGGTLEAALAFAERAPLETATEQKKCVAAVMRQVGEKLGNTAAVARSSYVSPAVVEQYLEGVTLEDFRPRHLRIVAARDIGLDQEERAVLALLRSWRQKQVHRAAA